MKHGQIKDIKIPLQAVLGETQVSVEDIATMGEGTIVELHSLAGDPIDLLAAGERIAKGEVVVIDENFGIRITKILREEE